MASKISGRRGASTPKNPGRGEGKERSSPLSPTRLSRLQEKAELQSLNDRLAAYIDRVRQLELENSRLSVQVETIQESVSKEVTTMKNLYEGELTDARRLLDDTAKEKASLQIDVGKLRSTNEDLRLKLAKKERELVNAEKSLAAAEDQVADLTAKLNTSEAERRKLLGELRELKEEVGRLAVKLSEAKQQLESETLMRVDLENRCQSLREELQFKHQVYEQEVSETKKRRHVEVSEIDGKLQAEYENRLAQSLQELRSNYEDQMEGNRAELEDLYQTKIEEMTRQQQQTSDQTGHLSNALKTTKREVSELSSKLAYLEGTNHTLQQRINDLEAQLEGERASHTQEAQKLQAEIDRLSGEMSLQLQEYQELMGIKVALDMEIAAYRKLLEAEEERLNISVSSLKSPASTLASTSSSSRRLHTPLRGGKRKRQEEEEEVKQSSSSFSSSFKSSSSSSGPLQISEDCPEGKFVKIVNTSDKDVALGGYQLIRSAGDGEQVTYKFHSKSKIAALGEICVWSCDLNVTHAPPSTIVMRNQKWPAGDTLVTKLITASEEIASRETKRESESYTSYSERQLPEAKRQAIGSSPEKCSVM